MSIIARYCAACGLPIDGPVTICRGAAHYHPQCVPAMDPLDDPCGPPPAILVAPDPAPQDDGVAMVGGFSPDKDDDLRLVPRKVSE